MSGASLEFDLSGFTDALDRLKSRLNDLTPLMAQIGEALLLSSQMRFETKTGPDGQGWAALAAATVRDRIRRRYGGANILQRTGALARSLNYRAGPDRVTVSLGGSGNSTAYAAFHQFGTRRFPARPVLGLSAEDERIISEIAETFMRAYLP